MAAAKFRPQPEHVQSSIGPDEADEVGAQQGALHAVATEDQPLIRGKIGDREALGIHRGNPTGTGRGWLRSSGRGDCVARTTQCAFGV